MRERAAWKALGALPLPSKRSEFAKNEYTWKMNTASLPACARLFRVSQCACLSVCCFPFPVTVCEFSIFFAFIFLVCTDGSALASPLWLFRGPRTKWKCQQVAVQHSTRSLVLRNSERQTGGSSLTNGSRFRKRRK